MHNIEPVNITIGVLSIILAPQIAEVIGPYAVIILASSIGASWSLGGKEPLSKGAAVWYFIRVNLTAILITVTAANYIGHKLNYTDSQWLLAPIALVIGMIGNDWANISKWIISKVNKLTDRHPRS